MSLLVYIIEHMYVGLHKSTFLAFIAFHIDINKFLFMFTFQCFSVKVFSIQLHHISIKNLVFWVLILLTILKLCFYL